MNTALVILAAGMGTRMNSDLPKVLHPLAGAPMLVHAMKAGFALEASACVIVTGHEAEAVAAAAPRLGRDGRVRGAGAAAWHRPCRGAGRAQA